MSTTPKPLVVASRLVSSHQANGFKSYRCTLGCPYWTLQRVSLCAKRLMGEVSSR